MKTNKKTNKKNKSKTLYLIATRFDTGFEFKNEIFSFDTKRNRSDFIKHLKKNAPEVEFATTEMQVKE